MGKRRSKTAEKTLASVWWDTKSCPVPEEEWCFNIFDYLSSDVFKDCEITIFVFSNTPIFLPDTSIIHITYNVSENHLKAMDIAMNDRGVRVPAPAKYLVISGDKSLASTLNSLHARDYEIFLAHPHGFPIDYADISASASRVWTFTSLAHGRAPYRVRVPPPMKMPIVEQQEKVPLLVIWDIESCPLPEESKWPEVIKNLNNAVSKHCPFNRLTKDAYGDLRKIPSSVRLLLSVVLPLNFTTNEHLPQAIKEAINNWARIYPAPANCLLISGNKSLVPTLNDLRRRNYNILLAHPDGNPGDYAGLLETASIVWSFTSLTSGEPPYRVCTPKKYTPSVRGHSAHS